MSLPREVRGEQSAQIAAALVEHVQQHGGEEQRDAVARPLSPPVEDTFETALQRGGQGLDVQSLLANPEAKQEVLRVLAASEQAAQHSAERRDVEARPEARRATPPPLERREEEARPEARHATPPSALRQRRERIESEGEKVLRLLAEDHAARLETQASVKEAFDSAFGKHAQRLGLSGEIQRTQFDEEAVGELDPLHERVLAANKEVETAERAYQDEVQQQAELAEPRRQRHSRRRETGTTVLGAEQGVGTLRRGHELEMAREAQRSERRPEEHRAAVLASSPRGEERREEVLITSPARQRESVGASSPRTPEHREALPSGGTPEARVVTQRRVEPEPKVGAKDKGDAKKTDNVLVAFFTAVGDVFVKAWEGLTSAWTWFVGLFSSSKEVK